MGLFTTRKGSPAPRDLAWPSPLWVISCRDAVVLRCPLFPRKLPRPSIAGAAAKGQKEKSGGWFATPRQDTAASIYYFVRDAKLTRRNTASAIGVLTELLHRKLPWQTHRR
jgi:hypothetical protein